ncbi:MAG: AAA family ATPase [Chitinophagaceae bacterium]
MFIKEISIQNYRIFDNEFKVDFNIPDNSNEGSGLTILCGENGLGKSTILDAIGLALQEYRGDTFTIDDMPVIGRDTEIVVITNCDFEVKSVLPKGKFKTNGFKFIGRDRRRNTSEIYGSLVTHYRQLLSNSLIHKNKEYEYRCEA